MLCLLVNFFYIYRQLLHLPIKKHVQSLISHLNKSEIKIKKVSIRLNDCPESPAKGYNPQLGQLAQSWVHYPQTSQLIRADTSLVLTAAMPGMMGLLQRASRHQQGKGLEANFCWPTNLPAAPQYLHKTSLQLHNQEVLRPGSESCQLPLIF